MAVKYIDLDYEDVIVVGRRGENEAFTLAINIAPLIEDYGTGTALILAKRPTDESAYPVTLFEQEGNTVMWTATATDTCAIGVGHLQLFWYVNNVLAKSFEWRTFIGSDITGMVGDPPSPYETWIEHLAEMGADILNDAKDEVKNAEAWAVGERGGEPVVDGDETYHNNAKYWSGVSSDYASSAESSADAAEQSAGDAAHQVDLAADQVTLAEAQVALAEQKVQDAAAQVALATEQAEAAASKATEASGYATDASGSATDAETYKTQAQGFSQDAGADAALALGYKNAAQTYAGNAETSATNAADSASAASTSATNASTSATNAANSATAAAASATSAAESAAHLVIDDELSTESENAVQNKLITTALETKAEVDGAYEQMTVGNAEQLVSNVGIEDSVPYNFRTSGGSADIGDREVDKIVGGTIAWNQRFPNRTGTYNTDAADIVANNDGSFTITIKVDGASTDGSNHTYIGAGAFVAGHKYLLYSSNPLIGFRLKAYQKDSNTVFIADGATYNNVSFLYSNLSIGTYTVKPMVFDLTQMFGSTIADYVYSLEQSTAGAGVAWFRKLFGKPYYSYNSGELMSVQTSAHKMVGFNAWDEEWEKGQYNTGTGAKENSNNHIRCKNPVAVTPNTNYFFNTSGYNINVCFMDANMGFISNFNSVHDAIRATPSNCRYIVFNMAQAYGTTYKNDICINLSWDGERDGEYEEYKQWVYPFDSDLTLRGIPKLSAANDLYYDGDIYESDGTVTRKYAQIVFDGSSDEAWGGTASSGWYIALNTLAKKTDYRGSIVCDKCGVNTANKASENGYVSGYADTNNQYPTQNWLYYTNTALGSTSALKTYLASNPMTVVYELAEPLTIQLTPQEVNSLAGDNTLWSDANQPLTVTYRSN